MQGIGHKIADIGRNVVSSLKSNPTESKFLEKGQLTSIEFVQAGDELVQKCPTWKWCSATKPNSNLPKEKQFLITKGVPCKKRLKALQNVAEIQEQQVEDEWVTAQPKDYVPKQVEVVEVQEEQKKEIQLPQEYQEVTNLSDEEPDPGIMEKVMQGEGYLTVEEPEENIIKTRVYDLSISFDFYYQTPRLWLVGYDEFNNPLIPQQIFEDIMEDYAQKTITMETHPFLGIPTASIHPCRHAEVMKRIIDTLLSNGVTPKVEHALFIFLKFISTVCPTIEYDYTVDIELA